MNRMTMIVAWMVSVIVAALFGWFAGVSNATRVAAGAAHLMMYVFLIAVLALGGTVAWNLVRHRDHHEPIDRPVV